MKLSEAIRLGAMWRPKAHGYFFLSGASCAQGAALEATGTRYSEAPMISIHCHAEMQKRWPWAYRQEQQCPACAHSAFVAHLIPHLNNKAFGGHDWTREAIADFVATVEPQTTDVAVGEALTEPVAVSARI